MNIQKNNLNGVESASIGLSVLGTIAGIITQQVAYVAAPLTLSLSLSLINRQKQLATAERRLANLEHQLVAVPATPNTVEFYKLVANVNTDRQELQRLAALITALENRDSNLMPFLTEIDLTKDSLKQLSLNFSNLERELNDRQDTRGNDRNLERLGSNIQMLAEIDVLEPADLRETNSNSLDLVPSPSSIYVSIEQIKLKLQFLEDSSKVSEDAIKQIGWRFLELEREFTNRQELIDIKRIDRALTEIDSNIHKIGTELTTTQAEQVLKLTNLDLDRDRIHESIAETQVRIQLLADKSIVSELVERVSDLDASLGDLHDYNLKLTNRLDNYTQHEIIDIINTTVTDLNIDNLIHQEVERCSRLQFDVFDRVLPKTYSYELVSGREESRHILMTALQTSQERLILVCPWVTKFALNQDVEALITAALNRGVAIDIGWGNLNDVNNDRANLSKEKILKSCKRKSLYNAIPWLYQLQTDYPELLTLRVLGTHEKFLVCDRQFAMLGSHNYMTSNVSSSEREVGIKTDSLEIIDKLVEIFDRAQG